MLAPGHRADMKRREFITLLGGAATWPLAARAQQPERVRRIGVLMSTVESDPSGLEFITAFAQGLAELGWSIGRNARKASRTVPIVFVTTIDPVGGGWVESLSRPGTNATGFASHEFSMSGKWLELLKEIAPGVKRAAVIRDPSVPAGSGGFAAIQTVAPSFGVGLTSVGVRDAGEIERGIATFTRGSNGGLIMVGPPSSVQRHRELIITLAARHRLPAVYPTRPFVISGGLISYGPDPIDQYRRAAGYVDRILKGEKPADMPVQAPTKFELVINLKTAKALGLTVPPTLLARADEVIE